MNDYQQNKDDDVWGAGADSSSQTSSGSSSYDTQPPASRFETPVRTLDGDPDLLYEEVNPAEDAASAAIKPRPNYAVLSVAAAVGLLTLVGAGLFVKSKMFPTDTGSRVEMMTQSGQLPVQGDPLPQAPGSTQAQGSASVFDQPSGKDVATGVPGLETAPAAGVAAAGSAMVAGAGAPVATSAASAPAAPPLAAKPAAPAQAAVSAGGAGATQVASTVGGAASLGASVNAQCDCAAEAAAKPAKPTRKSDKSRVTAPPAQVARADRPRKARPPKQVAQEPAPLAALREEAVLPEGMKVHAIYPQSGPDTQAWIREPSGRTTIVRVGEFLAGTRVTRINAEAGEVHTSSGVLTTYGSR